MSVTHILIADRRPIGRFALCALIGRQPGLKIVGEAKDAPSLQDQVRIKQPDIVLLDWRLVATATAALLAALKESSPHTFVIALSGRPEAKSAALLAGADGFVSKTDPPDRLLSAIRLAEKSVVALHARATRIACPGLAHMD
jgi:two-component system nitrate/nitrite response regulator NarL